MRSVYDDARKVRLAVKKEITQELEKQRPRGRYAIVQSINNTERWAEVIYVGEDVPVKVPFGMIGPNEKGQQVRIEGTPGDRYIAGIRGTTKVERDLDATTETANGAATTAEGAVGQIDSVNSEMNSQFDAYKYNRPISEGPDPTGTSNIDWASIDGTDIAVTAGLSRWGMMRCGLNTTDKATISFCAYRSGTVSAFYYDIYSINPQNGEFNIIYSSDNIVAALGTAMAFVYMTFPTIGSQPGTCFAIQFRSVGSGSVIMAGKTFRSYVPLPGFYPLKPGGQRIPGSDPVPATISGLDAQNFVYGDLVPFVQLGSTVDVSLGRHFYDLFNRSSMGSNWNLYHWGATGNNLAIDSGRVYYSGNQDGYQAGLWSYPMATDAHSAEATFTENGNARQNILFICSAFNLSGLKVALIRYSDKVGIFTPSGTNSASPRVEIPWIAGSNERWKIWYDPDTNTYKTSCDGEERGLSWVDSSNEVPHGLGRRSVGFGISRSLFFSGSPVDNFAADDWKD
ncbi:hypothetical protein SEA_CAMERICO_31 [Gordonia phage Camerico]|nr:hypothetical protein SEA_CAMERICO_31 [Gordonia phage Camerico]